MNARYNVAAAHASNPALHEAAYSTIVLQGLCNSGLCNSHINAFSYAVGSPIVPGTNSTVASWRETNLISSGQWVGEPTKWVGLSWTIPAVTPGAYLGQAYKVTQDDVDAFLSKSIVRFYRGSGNNPFLSLVPGHHPVQQDVAGWRQRVPLPGPFVPEHQSFWLELSWPNLPPEFAPGVGLAVTFRLTTEAEGIEVIGKREDLAQNPKEKLYVAVGEAGLEQLLEKLLWWKPESR